MKKLFAWILCMVMVLGLCAGCTTATQSGGGDQTNEGLKKITVTVVHSDGTSKDFTYETAEKFLGPVLVANGLIEGNDGPYGLEITKVDGEKAVYTEDKAYWALYEGAEYALQGIDTTPVVDGATYKLVYTDA